MKMSKGTLQIYLPKSEPSTASQRHLEIPPTLQVNLEDVEDFSNVCRICATVTELVIPIFNGEGLLNNLADKICKHLPIQVTEEDVLPRVVCYQCSSTILAWHELVQCSLQAEDALRTRLLVSANPEETDNETETNNDKGQNATTKEQENKDVKIPMLTVEVKIEPNDSDEQQESEESDRKPKVIVIGEDGRRYGLCSVCKKHIHVGVWSRHVSSHQRDRAYRCDACGAGFSDKSNLSRHKRSLHSKQRPYVCKTCQKTYTRKYHLEDHMKTHAESRDFICDTCGKAFKSGTCLRVHKKAHNDLQFDCVECGWKFKRLGELKSHKSVHTGEKAHACECGRSFRLLSQLNIHARQHHKKKNK